ncbi:MAG: hypothetical protein H8D38_05370 [DPANN group archaeon]|nr:hypothetical protein [DPANN group archaeon]
MGEQITIDQTLAEKKSFRDAFAKSMNEADQKIRNEPITVNWKKTNYIRFINDYCEKNDIETPTNLRSQTLKELQTIGIYLLEEQRFAAELAYYTLNLFYTETGRLDIVDKLAIINAHNPSALMNQFKLLKETYLA